MQLVSYCSRTKVGPEKKVPTTCNEYLPVVWAIVLRRSYFGGSRITVRTGHGVLKLLLTMTKATGKLACW